MKSSKFEYQNSRKLKKVCFSFFYPRLCLTCCTWRQYKCLGIYSFCVEILGPGEKSEMDGFRGTMNHSNGVYRGCVLDRQCWWLYTGKGDIIDNAACYLPRGTGGHTRAKDPRKKDSFDETILLQTWNWSLILYTTK